jgi:hypothetical protein
MFKSFLTIPRHGTPSKHRVPIAFTTCGHHVEHCVVSSMLQHLKYTSTRWLPMKTSTRQSISIICSWRTFHPQVLLRWRTHQQPTNGDGIWLQPLPPCIYLEIFNAFCPCPIFMCCNLMAVQENTLSACILFITLQAFPMLN